MSEKGKKVLIIGNGFDLAHGLPTKYINFLEFCVRVDLLWLIGIDESNKPYSIEEFRQGWIDKWDMEDSIKDYIVNAFQNRKLDGASSPQDVKIEDDTLIELYNLIHHNVWFRYFNNIYNNKCIKGENWIDFESEIRYVIQMVDETTDDLSSNLVETFQALQEKKDVKLNFFITCFARRIKKKSVKECNINVRKFREIAYDDLEKIIRALEIYLGKFVDKIQVDKRVPEIINLKPDYVINFNYTNTYERLYDNAPVFHIHGNCDVNQPIEKNNMVLGIDHHFTTFQEMENKITYKALSDV